MLRVDISSAFYATLAIGCVLLPFSTAPHHGGVVSFGLPFLFVAAMLAFPITLSSFRVMDGIGFVVALASISMILLMTIFAQSVLQSGVRAFVNLVGFSLYVGCLSVLLAGRFSVSQIARVGIFSCFILAIYFILNFAYASIRHGLGAVVVERYVGGLMSLPWGASNTIAQVLLLAFVMYAMLPRKARWDVVFIATIACAIGLTFSRSVIAMTVLMSLVTVRLSSVVVFLVALVCVLFGLFAAGVLDYSNLEVMVLDRINPEGLATAGGRLGTMHEKVLYFLDNPLAPIGYYSSLDVFELSAHNYWLTTLIEQSIPGVIVSLVFFAYAGILASVRSLRAGFAFVVVMLALMFEDPHFRQPYIVLFWLLLALLIAFGRGASTASRGEKT